MVTKQQAATLAIGRDSLGRITLDVSHHEARAAVHVRLTPNESAALADLLSEYANDDAANRNFFGYTVAEEQEMDR